MTIRDGPKRTISASSELGLLQMVSEPDTRRCANKEAPKGGGLLDPTSIGEGNETFHL